MHLGFEELAAVGRVIARAIWGPRQLPVDDGVAAIARGTRAGSCDMGLVA
jgi:hypothetical protein